MPVHALLKVMGHPLRSAGDRYSFEFREVHEEVIDSIGKATQGYENWGSLDVMTVQGRVVRLFAWYVGK